MGRTSSVGSGELRVFVASRCGVRIPPASRRPPRFPRSVAAGGTAMQLVIRGLDTSEVEKIRRGGPDANGQPALRRVAEGVANPCRHCLGLIAEGDEKLVLAWRPFPALQ